MKLGPFWLKYGQKREILSQDRTAEKTGAPLLGEAPLLENLR